MLVSVLFGSGVERWAALASALELAPFVPTASYSHGMSFRQCKRALGVRATGEPDYSHWLYGKRGETELIVLTFDTGSGSSRRTYTGVLARIDPPLLMGLIVQRRGFLDGVLGSDGVRTGDPSVDEKLNMSGFDPGRVVALLSPQAPEVRVLTAQLFAVAPLDVRVTDSVVLISTEGTITDADAVGDMLARAVWIANAFAARRRALPPTEAELQMHGEWQRFADAHRFTFDVERMKLEGKVDGSDVEMAIETECQISRTTVTVRFPSAVGVAFTARRTTLPSFLQGLLGQDIKVGDPRFDELFIVTGRPEAAVRDVLANPGVIAVLTDLGTHTTEVQLNHAQLHFSLPGIITATPQLLWVARAAQVVTGSLFARASAIGPYR